MSDARSSGTGTAFTREPSAPTPLWPIASTLVYVLVFVLVFRPDSGRAGVGVLALLPVCVIAWQRGTIAGASAGLGAIALTTALFNLCGQTGLFVLIELGGGPGLIALVAIGAAVGRARVLALKVNDQLREKINAVRALRASERRYALAARGANDGVWDWDHVRDRVYFSPRWRALMGMSPDDRDDRPALLLARVHPEDRERVAKSMRDYTAGESRQFECEFRVTRMDGAVRWMLMRAASERAGETIIRTAGSLTDITLIREAASEQTKTALLLHATESLEIGIIVLTDSLTPQSYGGALTELTAAWASPSAWWEALREHVTVLDRRECSICGRDERHGRHEVELEAPTGERRVFELVLTGHRHDLGSADACQIAFVRDTTAAALALKQQHALNERLLQARDLALAASRAKSEFLATMSHELRTPLNAIIGYTEMLSENAAELGGAQAEQDTHRILEASHHLLQLINEVLDLAKIESGHFEIDRVNVDVAALVKGIVETVRPLARRNGNTLELRLGDALGSMFTDQTRLRQVLLNILGNACKFTERGAVQIEVAREPGQDARSRRDDQLRFRVSDTGIGMDDSTQARIFQEFFQADGSRRREHEGTGLGLTLARHFCELMGGDVSVRSTPGLGSTFTVVLPAVAPASTPVRAREAV